MLGLASAARPLAGAALVSDATTTGKRAIGMKQQRDVAPAPLRLMGRESSSARHAGPGTFSVPRSAHVDVKKRAPGITCRVTSPVAPSEVACRKRQLSDPFEMASDSPARCPDVHFMDQKKRTKVTHGTADVEVVVCATAVNMPAAASTGPERLKKRLHVELDALHDLVKEAKLLYRGKAGRFLPDEPRPEASAVVGYGKTLSAKRTKTAPIVEHIDAQQMSPEEGEIIDFPDLEEHEDCIDICGGVSPVTIRDASPLVPLEKAKESKINIVPPEEADYVDSCGGATPLVPMVVASEACSLMPSSSDSESSSSSGSDSGSDSDNSSSDSDSDSENSSSDSDSESDSDSDESVDSPAPVPVPPKENSSPAQPAEDVISVPPPPPEPASETEQSTEPHESVSNPAPPPVLPRKIIETPAQPPAPTLAMVHSTEPEKKLRISVLIARKESREIQLQKGK